MKSLIDAWGIIKYGQISKIVSIFMNLIEKKVLQFISAITFNFWPSSWDDPNFSLIFNDIVHCHKTKLIYFSHVKMEIVSF